MEEKKKLTGRALYRDPGSRMRKLLQGARRGEADRGQLDNAVALGYCFGRAAVLELAHAAGAVSKGGERNGLETPAGQDHKLASTKGIC